MEPPTTLPYFFGLLHLLFALSHTLAHLQLGVFGSAAHSVFIVVVLHLVPAVALARMRRRPALAIGLLCAALAGSFVFGTYYHFVLVSPDHVAHVPSTPWTLPFQVSAVLLAICDGVGALALAVGMVRHSYLAPGGRHVILVDGLCVFCNRLVSMILRFDKKGVFHFAQLQSEFARGIVQRHGRDPDDVDSVYLLANAGTPRERLLIDGEVGREVWPRLFAVAAINRLVPLVLLNSTYRLFARLRYRLVGKYDHCHVPSPSERARYLE
jgi:predicted DCC family thiol-disulfide oxidoreductase YuxK